MLQQQFRGSPYQQRSLPMSGLHAILGLRRDPAQFSATDGAGTPPALSVTAPEIDPSGHTFSPSIRKQQKEIDMKMSEAPALAAKAKSEFERLYTAGFAKYDAGNADKALEAFAAAYVLAREMNFRW